MIMIFYVIRLSSIEYVFGLSVVFIVQQNNNKLTVNHKTLSNNFLKKNPQDN